MDLKEFADGVHKKGHLKGGFFVKIPPMREREFLINTSDAIISPDILNGYVPPETHTSFDEYFQWLQGKQFTTEPLNDLSRISMQYEPKLQPAAPNAPLRSFFELPYLIGTGISSGTIPALRETGNSNLDLRADTAYGISKLADIMRQSADGQIDWRDTGWHVLYGQPFYELSKQVPNEELGGFDHVDCTFYPYRRRFKITWLETNKLKEHIASEAAPLLKSEVRLETATDTRTGISNISCDFDVRQQIRQYNPDTKRWFIKTHTENMIDALLGEQKHHVALATGEWSDLVMLQKAIMRNLQVEQAYKPPKAMPRNIRNR